MLDGSRAVSAFSTDGKLAISPRDKLQRSAPPQISMSVSCLHNSRVTALMIGTVPTAKAPVVPPVEALKA